MTHGRTLLAKAKEMPRWRGCPGSGRCELRPENVTRHYRGAFPNEFALGYVWGAK